LGERKPWRRTVINSNFYFSKAIFFFKYCRNVDGGGVGAVTGVDLSKILGGQTKILGAEGGKK